MKNGETYEAKFPNLGSVTVEGEAEISLVAKECKVSAYSLTFALPQYVSLLVRSLFFPSAAISDVLECLMADRRRIDIRDH